MQVNLQWRVCNKTIKLVNPFKYSVAPISLPPLEHRNKVTLSADPITSPSDYVVAAINHCGRLAFKIRASQSFWIRVYKNELWCTNVVFYKGLIFADNLGHTIVSFKFNNPPCDDSNDPNFTYYEKIASTRYSVPTQSYCEGLYFVKSLNGDIWLVRRNLINQNDKSSYNFDVYKLELDGQSGKLEQMNKLESLEDNILFVGNRGDSISLSASSFSKMEKNSIYFVDESDKDGFELHIYNAQDGSVDSRSLPRPFRPMLHFWVLPQFQWDSPVHL